MHPELLHVYHSCYLKHVRKLQPLQHLASTLSLPSVLSGFFRPDPTEQLCCRPSTELAFQQLA